MTTRTQIPEGEIEASSLPDRADIVVGIASYNNSRTIGHVVRAVDAGLAKYFPSERAVIINSDGGSSDKTPEIVINASVDHKAVFLSHRIHPVNRITTPYHGIPGKGSAFRTIFKMASALGAKACCVVDADLRSITPEWIELLLSPVYKEGFDFVAPLYARHKYDGTITNSIIYPLTRSLYCRKIRQPIGGEFGFSGEMARFYVGQDVWNTDIARFGIDIWMTTEALAGRFKVCQAYLGAKIHDPKDPGADLRDMFVQVVGSLMSLTEKHSAQWRSAENSIEVPTFGFKYQVGVVPIKASVEGMLRHFRLGAENLGEIWAGFMDRETVDALARMARAEAASFRFPKEMWVRMVYDYILAYHERKLQPEQLLKTLIPLYYGRTASFFLETVDMNDEEAEAVVEEVSAEYERQKEYLVSNWREGVKQ
ncbi:MAG: glycosyl transferase family 2 [Deltaproteobacteria bacterium]|nr:glycosyl transferase family 2 [Deltaproteobacteria bacterium]MCL4874501.1 glycosyl transferase family 2 [bacterium]